SGKGWLLLASMVGGLWSASLAICPAPAGAQSQRPNLGGSSTTDTQRQQDEQRRADPERTRQAGEQRHREQQAQQEALRRQQEQVTGGSVVCAAQAATTAGPGPGNWTRHGRAASERAVELPPSAGVPTGPDHSSALRPDAAPSRNTRVWRGSRA